MSGLAYPRNRIETCLIEAVLPLSYRIIPGNYLTSPLGTAPADSRFCTKLDGYTVLTESVGGEPQVPLQPPPLLGAERPSVGTFAHNSPVPLRG